MNNSTVSTTALLTALSGRNYIYSESGRLLGHTRLNRMGLWQGCAIHATGSTSRVFLTAEEAETFVRENAWR